MKQPKEAQDIISCKNKGTGSKQKSKEPNTKEVFRKKKKHEIKTNYRTTNPCLIQQWFGHSNFSSFLKVFVRVREGPVPNPSYAAAPLYNGAMPKTRNQTPPKFWKSSDLDPNFAVQVHLEPKTLKQTQTDAKEVAETKQQQRRHFLIPSLVLNEF